MTLDHISFEEQAKHFEERAGLTPPITQKIADAIYSEGGMMPSDTLVEVGAGTGEIGQFLIRDGHHYIGFDQEDEMLEIFRQRIESTENAKILCADANEKWPVEAKSARVVFGSRVFHLLDIPKALAEAKRVAHPEGMTLFIGRVKREKDSPKTRSRKKMRELLKTHGFEPRDTDRKREIVFEEAETLGATVMKPIQAVSWEVRPRPIDSIQGWAKKDSMGGITPPAEIRQRVLDELHQWAKDDFGDPTKEMSTKETYILEGIRFSS